MISTIVYLVPLILVELLAVTASKQWANDDGLWYFAVAVISYAIVGVIFSLMVSKINNITIANSIWQVANIVFVTGIGLLAYSEKLTSIQWVAFILAIMSIVLFFISDIS